MKKEGLLYRIKNAASALFGGTKFTSAVILAGGSGTRVGADKTKQMIELCGKPLVVHTLLAFEACDYVNEIVVVAKQDEIEDGVLDTAKVKAFKVPAGVMVEVYATTLHYAPCHADAKKGFRVMVALPDQTNTDFRPEDGANKLDKTLWARNKWLLAHPDSSEAKQGAAVLLKGENIDIAGDI